jgi:D-3-phosphoglycerate dehydrogenase / 2-oxoglutarate reductase
MNVIGADPGVDLQIMRRCGIKKVSMNELFKKSDIVSVHVALEYNTHNLVKEKHFKLMKPSSFLINTSRGEIIDERALLKSLQKKWISGAALDVLQNEHSDGRHLKDNSLIEYAKANNNLIVVPHIGGATYDAMQITEEFIAKLVKKYFHN